MNLLRNVLILFFSVILVIMPVNSTPIEHPTSSSRVLLHGSEVSLWTESDKNGGNVVVTGERFDGDTVSFFNRLKEIAPVQAACFVGQVQLEWQSILDRFAKNPAELIEPERDFAVKLKGYESRGQSFEQTLTSMFMECSNEAIAKVEKDGAGNTINFIVTAKNETGSVLGYVIFNKKLEYPNGSIELEPIGIISSAQGRGLFRLLVTSIFKIYPETKRVFAHVRKTNIKCQMACEKMGFVKYGENSDHILFEYIKP